MAKAGADRARAERRAQTAVWLVRRLVAAGHSVVRFSEHHYRVGDRYDYWPTTGRWQTAGDRKVAGWRAGVGIEKLLQALR